MRVLVTGGGTAGHIYPALTVAAQLAAGHDDVVFVGTPDGLEARLVPEAGVSFHALPARGFDRARPWTLLSASLLILISAVRAWRLLGRVRPDVVAAFGAYVSLPVGIAARLRKVPLVLHEQNSVPGLANKILSKWAVSVGATYADSAELLAHPARVTVTGNPIRAEVAEASREQARARLGLGSSDLVLLIFGGSRGARHINSAAVGSRERLLALPNLKVMHVAGPTEVDTVREQMRSAPLAGDDRWRVYDYLPEMGDAIAASDLVVSRAGATTIAELTALGAPAIVVPYPYATDDHQTKNAATLLSHGAAALVPDAKLDDPVFCETLVELLSDGDRRATMAAASRSLGRPDAAERVVALLREAASLEGRELASRRRSRSTRV